MNASMNDRKKAVLLAAVLLVIAILCGIRIYAVSHSATGNGQALYADIYQNGELLESIRLDTVTDEYIFEVPGEGGASNTICVRPDSIAIISATCPDQICVHQGFISTSLLPITCLPNRLVIRVREAAACLDDTTLVPDGVTY